MSLAEAILVLGQLFWVDTGQKGIFRASVSLHAQIQGQEWESARMPVLQGSFPVDPQSSLMGFSFFSNIS